MLTGPAETTEELYRPETITPRDGDRDEMARRAAPPSTRSPAERSACSTRGSTCIDDADGAATGARGRAHRAVALPRQAPGARRAASPPRSPPPRQSRVGPTRPRRGQRRRAVVRARAAAARRDWRARRRPRVGRPGSPATPPGCSAAPAPRRRALALARRPLAEPLDQRLDHVQRGVEHLVRRRARRARLVLGRVPTRSSRSPSTRTPSVAQAVGDAADPRCAPTPRPRPSRRTRSGPLRRGQHLLGDEPLHLAVVDVRRERRPRRGR